MVNDQISNLDNLSREELLTLMKLMMVRNNLLVKISKLQLFRYVVKEDLMWFMFEHPEKGTLRIPFENYTKNNPKGIFSDIEHKKVCDMIKKVVSDPETPKTGNIVANTTDGRRIRIEYSSYFNEKGEIEELVGEHVDEMSTVENMKKVMTKLNKFTVAFDTIGKAYGSIISIDLSDFSYEVLLGTPTLKEITKHATFATEIVDLMCAHDIDPEFYEAYRTLLNPKTIQERMEGKKFLEQNLKSLHFGWMRARLFPLETDKHGVITKVLYTSERIAKPSSNNLLISHVAERDSLTELLTREKGKKKIKDLLSQKTPFIIAHFTCDFFDSYIELLGHIVADKIALAMADVAKQLYGMDNSARVSNDGVMAILTTPELFSLNMSDDELLAYFNAFQKILQTKVIDELCGMPLQVSGVVIKIDGQKELPFNELAEKAIKQMEENQKPQNGIVTLLKE